MKELVIKKWTLECQTIEVSYNCSAILTKNLVSKKEDLGAFTIPYTIGACKFSTMLCNLGTNINLVAITILEDLGLDTHLPTIMWLLMDDRSINRLVGILCDTLVKVDKFILPVNFVIFDYEIDVDVPIILGWLFLAIERALEDRRMLREGI